MCGQKKKKGEGRRRKRLLRNGVVNSAQEEEGGGIKGQVVVCVVLLLFSGGGEERNPNQQLWYAKWKLSWNVYTLHTSFCTFGADLYAQSVLISKKFSLELSRKFIKSALLIGKCLKKPPADYYFWLLQ